MVTPRDHFLNQQLGTRCELPTVGCSSCGFSLERVSSQQSDLADNGRGTTWYNYLQSAGGFWLCSYGDDGWLTMLGSSQ